MVYLLFNSLSFIWFHQNNTLNLVSIFYTKAMYTINVFYPVYPLLKVNKSRNKQPTSLHAHVWHNLGPQDLKLAFHLSFSSVVRLTISHLAKQKQFEIALQRFCRPATSPSASLLLAPRSEQLHFATPTLFLKLQGRLGWPLRLPWAPDRPLPTRTWTDLPCY